MVTIQYRSLQEPRGRFHSVMFESLDEFRAWVVDLWEDIVIIRWSVR